MKIPVSEFFAKNHHLFGFDKRVRQKIGRRMKNFARLTKTRFYCTLYYAGQRRSSDEAGVPCCGERLFCAMYKT